MKQMNNNRVKAAIVGCGMISDIYIRNLSGNSRLFDIIEVVACCDRKMETAKSKADQYGLKEMTLENICADSEIELVINLTNPSAHYDVIKQSLLAGKNVYTEKVLCTELEQARELVALANEKGLYLGASPDTFLGASIQNARQIVESGLIGEVTSCHASVNRDHYLQAELIPYVTRQGGGIGFDVGIYYVTALLSILGPVARVSGFMKTRNADRRHIMAKRSDFCDLYHVECENLMVGVLDFESGVVGTLHFNSESIMNEQAQLIIYGTEGIVFMGNPDRFGDDVKLLRKGQTEPVVIPSNFGYSENSRGIGVAEMAWAMREHRGNRASKEMALNALEALHGIAISSASNNVYELMSRFDKTPPLKQGYLDTRYYNSDPEISLVMS